MYIFELFYKFLNGAGICSFCFDNSCKLSHVCTWIALVIFMFKIHFFKLFIFISTILYCTDVSTRNTCMNRVVCKYRGYSCARISRCEFNKYNTIDIYVKVLFHKKILKVLSSGNWGGSKLVSIEPQWKSVLPASVVYHAPRDTITRGALTFLAAVVLFDAIPTGWVSNHNSVGLITLQRRYSDAVAL
jgi:hypothetical protein